MSMRLCAFRGSANRYVFTQLNRERRSHWQRRYLRRKLSGNLSARGFHRLAGAGLVFLQILHSLLTLFGREDIAQV